MRILLINKFLFPKGGDAISTLTTGKILQAHGHDVFFWGMTHPDNPHYELERYFVSNVDYNNSNGLINKSKQSFNILYSFEAKKKIGHALKKFRPDIVHLNNFAHQISPSILDEIKKHKIPIVMTMRDYKMVCPIYSMYVKGVLCEKCSSGKYYHCIFRRCNKSSLLKSFVNVLEMYLHHTILHIYDKIDVYISPSQFLKDKVKEMGLNYEVIHLPNCIDTSKFQPAYEWKDNSIVYFGRLSYEKGIPTLLNAMKNIPEIRLKIIGDGPLKTELEKIAFVQHIKNVEFCGYRTGHFLYHDIKKAMFLIVPSEWYENNPRTVIEAFALGKPVVGSRIGGIPELVQDWKTGLTYTCGDKDDLEDKIQQMLKNFEKIPEMGRNARNYVEEELNSELYYKRLIDIYNFALLKCAKN